MHVIATPAALAFLDLNALEGQTGHPVRSEYAKPERSGPLAAHADAIVVAPATYNTINKWALGISDTYALGILAEAPGLRIPVVVLPFVRRPRRQSEFPSQRRQPPCDGRSSSCLDRGSGNRISPAPGVPASTASLALGA